MFRLLYITREVPGSRTTSYSSSISDYEAVPFNNPKRINKQTILSFAITTMKFTLVAATALVLGLTSALPSSLVSRADPPNDPIDVRLHLSMLL